MDVIQTRGPLVETRHVISVVAMRDEVVVWQSGPPLMSPWRSCGKPWQLRASLQALGAPELGDADLAIGASSHSGQDFHVARVRALLERFGANEDDLRCGAEAPAHAATAARLAREGLPCLAVHNDCSGKHTYMLAAAVNQGWARDYRDPSHPLQALVLEQFRLATDESPAVGVDGCGVPVPGLTVLGMARAWSRLAAQMDRYVNGPRSAGPSRGEQRSDPLLAKIGWAMARHPLLVSGDDRLDLAVANAAVDPIVCKVGARGVYGIALPRTRLGIAIKVQDGDEDALGAAIPAVLAAVAPLAWRQPASWPWSVVTNVSGAVVGARSVDKLSLPSGAIGA